MKHSLCLLDQILSFENPNLIQLVEAIFLAACRCRDKRFGEALTLSWSICEQILYQLWKKFLNEANERESSSRISKNRRQKLIGRDYTASIIVEILELIEVLDQQTYRSLDACRRARNGWIHELKTPKQNQVEVCVRMAQDLLFKYFGVKLYLQTGGRGGVPSWNRWLWDQIAREER